jgi:2-polyprenyl-6-methoxyphenol hydroxylase-like FAD-dependent oxidoreductase
MFCRVVPQWANQPRVTVIGDAIHSMTPAGRCCPSLTARQRTLTRTGRLGANTAMRDSVLLGRLLAECNGNIDGVTAAYKTSMRTYESKAVAASYGIVKKTAWTLHQGGLSGLDINRIVLGFAVQRCGSSSVGVTANE